MSLQLRIALIVSLVMIGWAAWVVSGPRTPTGGEPPTATIQDGVQYIDVTAKVGYSPRVVVAQAGVPTILRVSTKNTFDCSSSLVIPKLGYQKFLRPTASEEISISKEQAQGTLQGLCSMGMYSFRIEFR